MSDAFSTLLLIGLICAFFAWRVYTVRRDYKPNPKSDNDPSSDNYSHQHRHWDDDNDDGGGDDGGGDGGGSD